MERFRAFTPIFDGLCEIRDRRSRITQTLHAGYKRGARPYLTPSFFCRLDDDVVYWKTRRLFG
jgi:hypothetical protein